MWKLVLLDPTLFFLLSFSPSWLFFYFTFHRSSVYHRHRHRHPFGLCLNSHYIISIHFPDLDLSTRDLTSLNPNPNPTRIENTISMPSIPPTANTSPSQKHRPHLSTLLADYNLTLDDLLILALYPATALLGQTVQLLGTVSTSYFSSKRNVFNVVFVKKGWLWVSLLAGAKGLELYRSANSGSGKSRVTNGQVKGFVLRYILATVWWILFSQWFFGLPLMDRVFRLTGGACTPSASTLTLIATAQSDDPASASASEAAIQALSAQLAQVTSAKCKALGHSWAGGVDPSGHMFLLAHGSLYLWFEIMLPAFNSRQASTTSSSASSTKHNNTNKPRLSTLAKATAALLFIFWWMMLMTNMYYFHSFLERLSGLIWGYVEAVVVYIVARQVPAMQFLLS